MAIQFESSIDVDGRGIIGSGNTIGTINASIIGANNNATTLSTVDSNTNTIIGDSNSGRYGNTVITDRTLRLGRADNIGATSSNTTGILNFNDSTQANQAFSNVGGFVGYFPPPTTSNNYYFFSAVSENVLDSVFQGGASPTASRMNFSTDPGLSSILQKFDANTTNGGAMYVNASNNSATASSRGIVTFDVRHQNQNADVPDGHSLFEVTAGYGQTKFLIKQVSGSTNVGIGTTSPTQKLHVSGNARVTGAYYDSNNVSGTSGQILSSTATGTNWISGSAIPGVPDGSGTTNYLARWTDADTLGIGTTYDNGTNVGIGTTSPSQKLHVAGNGYFQNGSLSIGTTSNVMFNYITTFCIIAASGATITLGGGPGNVNNNVQVGNGDLYVPNGDVGIGTTSPSAKLEVNGDIALSGDNKVYSEGDTLTLMSGGTNGTYLVIDDTSGNVGIGTTSPSSALQVNGDLTVGDDATIGSFINVIAAGTSQDAGIRFGSESNTDSKAAIYTNTSNSDLHFDVTESTRMLIDSGTGNVGIGTTNPSQKLDVAGNMRLQNQLYDSTNSQGTNNDVLTKVSAGTEWKSLSDIPGNVSGSGTTNYIPKWSNASTLTDSGIVETSTLTTINNASFEYDYSGTTFLNIDGTTGTFLLGQPSTASRVYIHGIQTHLRFYTNNVKAGEFDSNQNFYVPNGNVGIGTLSPNHELVVQGTSSPNIELKNSNYSNGGFVLNRTNYTQQWKWWAESSVMYFGFATDESTYSTKLAIESSGNVGIGETNPDTLLHITGNEPTIKLEDNVAVDYYNPKIEFFGSAEGGTLEYISNPGFAGMRLHYRNNSTNQDTFLELKNGQASFTSANITGGTNVSMTGELQVFGGDTSYFSIGNVAIGATTSSERLYVVGNTSITNNLYVGTGNSLKSCTYSAQHSLVVGKSNILGGIANGIIGVSNTIECTNEPWLDFGGNFIAGINNTINNLYSHANAVFGQSNAVGDPTTASNSVTGILASGVGHSTFGSNSVAFGESCFTDISAQRSLTGGFDCNNFGYYGSVAIGAGATASTGNNQYAFGTGVTTPTTVSAAYGADQFVVGKFNEYTNASSVPHRFAVGNGASDASRDTPFCVIGSGTYTNGQVSINDADGFAYTSVPYSIFHVNGRATSSYSSTFTTTSDERVKKNIVDYSKGLAEIIQVQPKSYAFNGKGNTIEDVESIGVLAQEIKEVFPETVGTVNKRLNPEDEQETELYTVDISPVTYALINAVKELNAKVEALEARIQTLEGN